MKHRQTESILRQERSANEQNYLDNWKPEKLDEAAFYAKFAQPLRQGGNNHRYPGMKAFLDDLLAENNGPFLDCACGAGEMAIWLALHGKQVWAFDFSQNAIRIAQRSAELSGVADRIKFDLMDARDLKYEDNFFGVVTGKDCLHHLIKYPQAIRELARVLKPGGKGCFYEPLAFNPLICLLRPVNTWIRGYVGEHMLTRDDIRQLRDAFGDVRLSHQVVLSSFTRFVASTYKPLRGIRRKICIALIDLDCLVLARFSSLARFAACAYIQLGKCQCQ